MLYDSTVRKHTIKEKNKAQIFRDKEIIKTGMEPTGIENR